MTPPRHPCFQEPFRVLRLRAAGTAGDPDAAPEVEPPRREGAHGGRVLLESLRTEFWVLLLAASGVVTAGVGLVLRRLSPAPGAMTALALAGTVERADALLARWGEGSLARLAAAFALDFPFVIGYVVLLGGLALWASTMVSAAWLRVVLEVLAAAQAVGAAADAVENAAVLRYLTGDRRPLWPRLARAAALVELSLVAGGIGWVASYRNAATATGSPAR